MRWYYNHTKNECSLFPYMGCGRRVKTNENNFINHTDCMSTCQRKYHNTRLFVVCFSANSPFTYKYQSP